jgi:hypothetical protein
VVACVLLGDGASWNANVVRIGPAPFCPYLKDGILATGGVLALVATALGITSFILLRSQPAAAADVVAAPAGAPPNVSTTTTGGGQQQQLPAGVAIGHPQFPPAAAKPSEQLQFPPTPQGYGQAQVAPTVSHAMVHTPPQMTPQHFHPQGHGSHAPNQQYPPPPPPLPQVLPANTAPLPAPTGVQSFSPQPQVGYAQPQPVQSYSPQNPAARPQAYEQAPAVPPVAASQGLINAGANLLMRVAEHALSSDDTAAAADPDTTAGDAFVLPSTGDSTTQDGGQDTNHA